MTFISKRILYISICVISLITAIVSVLFSQTLISKLIIPISLLLVLCVPGILAYLNLVGIGRLDVRSLIYGVGLSASLLMVLGFTINLAHQVTGFRPLRPIPVWVSFGVLLTVLGIGIERLIQDDVIEITIPKSAEVYLSVAIPLAAGVGTVILQRGGPNIFAVLIVGVIILLYLTGAFHPTRRYALIYFLALSLLLHNTLATQFLLWGDQEKEAILVYRILQAGYWDPTEYSYLNKSVMLSIVILHPIRSLLTGLGTNLIFKLAHPLMFAIAPVALYHSFVDLGRDRAGYLAAGAFMIPFPFMTVLSRNTRTATAILFVILFLHALLDTKISPWVRRILLSVFGGSIFISHYGTGYMFLAMLVIGFLIVLLSRKLLVPPSQIHQQIKLTTLSLIVLVGVAWYTYVPPDSTTLHTLVGFLLDFSQSLEEGFLQPSRSATANYAVSSFSSISLTGIKILTFILFGFVGMGWFFTAIRTWRGVSTGETNASYLGISAVAGTLAAVTFLPVERFNTARTVMVVLAVVAPFFGIGAEYILKATLRRCSIPDWTTTVVCLLVLVPYFVFSTGLFAATITHDYSPNVLLYQDEVIEGGSPASKSYLYKQYLPMTEAVAGRWLQDHATGVVYGSQWPGSPDPGVLAYRAASRRYEYRGNISATPYSSCVYLSPLSVKANVIILPSSHFDNEFLRTSEYNTSPRSRVYANGAATLDC